MLDLSKRKTQSKKTKILSNKDYFATVTSVEWTKGFVEGKAFDVVYDLVDEAGNTSVYRETFYEDVSNERTADFYKHLVDIGISDLADYVGCTEKLVFLKDVKGNRTYTNIAKRTLISLSGDQQA